LFDTDWIQRYWLYEDRDKDIIPDPAPYDWSRADIDRQGSTMKLTEPTPERGELPGLSDWDKGAHIGQKVGGALGLGSLGAGLGGGVGAALGALGPIGAGLGVVSTIAGMIGSKKAQDEAEDQRRKEEALRRAAWMSQNRERAVGRWGY